MGYRDSYLHHNCISHLCFSTPVAYPLVADEESYR